MDDTVRVRPLGVIICDDIRKEENGKLLIVGAYPEGIAISNLPAQLTLGVIFLFQSSGPGHVSFQIELRAPGGDTARANIEMDVKYEPRPHSVATVPLSGIPVAIKEEGDMILAFRHKDDEWQTLRIMPVELNTELRSKTINIASD